MSSESLSEKELKKKRREAEKAAAKSASSSLSNSSEDESKKRKAVVNNQSPNQTQLKDTGNTSSLNITANSPLDVFKEGVLVQEVPL